MITAGGTSNGKGGKKMASNQGCINQRLFFTASSQLPALFAEMQQRKSGKSWLSGELRVASNNNFHLAREIARASRGRKKVRQQLDGFQESSKWRRKLRSRIRACICESAAETRFGESRGVESCCERMQTTNWRKRERERLASVLVGRWLKPKPWSERIYISYSMPWLRQKCRLQNT